MKAVYFMRGIGFSGRAFGVFCYTEKAYLYPFKRGRRREGRTDTAAFWDGKGKR